MPNYQFIDASGGTLTRSAAGAGTSGDPLRNRDEVVITLGVGGGTIAPDYPLPVAGTVQLSGWGTVAVSNPAGTVVHVLNQPTVYPVFGTVGVSNPAGTVVHVLNHPATYAVLGTVTVTNPGSSGGTLAVWGNVASGATDTGNPVKVGGRYTATLPTFTDGQRGDLQITNRGELIMAAQDVVTTPNNINTADSASTTATGEDGQTIITGNATNNSTVVATGSGNSSFAVLVTGSWTGTLQFERSLDGGTTWTPVAAFSAGTAYSQATITGNGAFHGNASSATNIRVRATAWTTGVASVRILLGAGTGTVTVGNPIRLISSDFTASAAVKGNGTAPTSADGALVVNLSPNSAGATPYRNINLGTAGVVVKASAGVMHGYYLFNAATSTRYIKVYNQGTAASQANTPVLTIPIPAGAAANLDSTRGIAFSAGISLRATTGLADNDTGAPTANDVVVGVWYA